jgi:hypothetical protein
VRQPLGTWRGVVHCLRHTLAGLEPRGLSPHWLPPGQSDELVQLFVQ